MKQRQVGRNQPSTRRNILVPVIVPIVVAIIGALGIIIAAFFTDESGEYRGRQSMFSELAPTIELQETTITELLIASSATSQPITITEIVYATPLPSSNSIHIETFLSSVRTYSLTESRAITPEVKLGLSSGKDPFLDLRMDFNIPENERSSVGIAFDFMEPTDISSFQFLDVSVEFSNKNLECSLILNDAAGGSGFVNIGSAQPSGNNVSVTVTGKVQTIRIPINENFIGVNKNIITTMFCVTGSAFTEAGNYYIILRDITFEME